MLKIGQDRFLETSWKRLWRVLWRLRVVSVRFWACWSVLAVSGSLWVSGLHPGASWGAIIAPGRVCGAFKTPQKSVLHLEYAAVSPREGVPHRTGSILRGFWVHVGIILAPFLCPWVRSILEGFGATFQHVFVNSGGLS